MWHNFLIGSQVNCNKGIYFNLSTHIVTYSMLCIYLTLNHQIIAPQYRSIAPQYISVALQYIPVAPHPTAIATLYGTASFQYEVALRFRDIQI